ACSGPPAYLRAAATATMNFASEMAYRVASSVKLEAPPASSRLKSVRRSVLRLGVLLARIGIHGACSIVGGAYRQLVAQRQERAMIQGLDGPLAAPHDLPDVCIRQVLDELEYQELLSLWRQELLILKFVEHLPNADIGQIMGRSEGAIKSLYHRTLLSLRDELAISAADDLTGSV